jgi:acylphosphatase
VVAAPGTSADVTRRFTVSGQVQGVGYRWFVARHARGLGLSGFACNLADGRVEVVASGDDAALARLEALLRTGPANARVASVERADHTDDPRVPTRSFDIR